MLICVDEQRNIFIREMNEDDVKDVNRIRNESREFLHNEEEYDLQQSIDWFNENNPEWYIITKDESVIGYFRTSDLSVKDRYLYIGADLEENSRGQKIAVPAYEKMMEFLFKKHKLQEIRLEVLEDNTRAASLYKKLGFIESGSKKIWRKSKKVWLRSIFMVLKRADFILLQMQREEKIAMSPCIGICAKSTDICNACGRTLDEISQWKDMERSSKILCLERLATEF